MAKDQFGFGTKKSDWIPFEQDGKKYVFANIPEVHKIMQSGNIFKMKKVFNDLMSKGHIKEV